ncbi:MAG: hypothetical protein JWR72_3743 [Flavisolibacter sp.]|nr:hypothetical protein [Flavisolibacter sp.]
MGNNVGTFAALFVLWGDKDKEGLKGYCEIFKTLINRFN